MKKLPTDSTEVSACEIMLGLFRMRADGQLQNPECSFHKFLLGMVHRWSQAIEASIEPKLLSTCPDPNVAARVHPWMKASRTRGNKTLSMSRVHRFTARGSGFISTKECSLQNFGLVAKGSTFSNRTTSEYACRLLMKTAEFFEVASRQSTVLNFCFDAAFVSEEHVSQLYIQIHYVSISLSMYIYIYTYMYMCIKHYWLTIYT